MLKIALGASRTEPLDQGHLRSLAASAYFDAEGKRIDSLLSRAGLASGVWCAGAPAAGGDAVALAILLAENGLSLTVSEQVKTQLAEEGYSEQYGARPLVRLIKRKLGFPIAQSTLRGDFRPGDRVTASLVRGEIVISK